VVSEWSVVLGETDGEALPIDGAMTESMTDRNGCN